LAELVSPDGIVFHASGLQGAAVLRIARARFLCLCSRLCCSVATRAAHSPPPRPPARLPPCPCGPSLKALPAGTPCPLGIDHPPTGEEFVRPQIASRIDYKRNVVIIASGYCSRSWNWPSSCYISPALRAGRRLRHSAAVSAGMSQLSRILAREWLQRHAEQACKRAVL